MSQHFTPVGPPPGRCGDVPGAISQDVLAERFKGLKRQIPLLYALVIANLVGFHIAAKDQPSWTIVCAGIAASLILYRLIHWHRLNVGDLSGKAIKRELQRNLRFTQILSVLFLAWSLSILADGGREQQQYVILFSSLAAIGCSVALSSAPDAARQPLMLLALPVSVWAMLASGLDLFILGFSLLIVVLLVSRILQLQDRSFDHLLSSKATILNEREKLRASEERYNLVSRATNDLIWDWDLTTGHVAWNDALVSQLGYAVKDIQPSADWWLEHIHPDHQERVIGHIHELIGCGENKFEDEYPFRKADGSYAHMYDRGFIIRSIDGAAVRMVGAMQDLTERKRAEENLLRAATRDPLTNLPNRKVFLQELDGAVREAIENSRWCSLLLLDLDEFKQVNDMMGHDAGDALLKELASRLSESLPDGSVLARLGGDEFGVILKDVASASKVEVCAEALLAHLRQPFVRDGRVLDCGATIGAALIPHHGKKPDEVLKSADMALYAAKTDRRGGFLLFEPRHRAEIQKRVAMRGLAKAAIRESRIVPFYQSQVRLDDQTVVGFEALLRWRQPGRGIQLPGAITAAFDDLELAAAISDRMIERVIADVRAWLEQDLPFGHVALNASAAEFRRDGFAERLLGQLQEYSIPPERFQLEVTESVFLGRGSEYVDRALKMLSSAGVSIALDDFGTGYASLRHLKQFPVNIIKIDRSFVRDMGVDPEDDAIVRAVINLGRSLGIEVVAEGIETSAQAEHLSNLGCNLGQGFLFSKAVPANRVPGQIKQLTAAGSKPELRRSPPSLSGIAGRS